MAPSERDVLRQLYALQAELFELQGDEIDGLRKALNALTKSHEVIAKMMGLTKSDGVS